MTASFYQIAISSAGIDILIPVALGCAGIGCVLYAQLAVILITILIGTLAFFFLPVEWLGGATRFFQDTYDMRTVANYSARYTVPGSILTFAFIKGLVLFMMANGFLMLLTLSGRTQLWSLSVLIVFAYYAELWFPKTLPHGYVNRAKWILITILVLQGNLHQGEFMQVMGPFCFFCATEYWTNMAEKGSIRNFLTQFLLQSIPHSMGKLQDLTLQYYDQMSVQAIGTSAYEMFINSRDVLADFKKKMEDLKKELDASDSIKEVLNQVKESAPGESFTRCTGFLLAVPSVIAVVLLLMIKSEMKIWLCLGFIPIIGFELKQWLLVVATVEPALAWRYLAACDGTPQIIAAVRTVEGLIALIGQGPQRGERLNLIEFIRLAACIVVDIIGASSFFFPPLEIFDFIVAPLAAGVTYATTGGVLAPGLAAAKEMLIFTDIVPVSTISYIIANPHLLIEMAMLFIRQGAGPQTG